MLLTKQIIFKLTICRVCRVIWYEKFLVLVYRQYYIYIIGTPTFNLQLGRKIHQRKYQRNSILKSEKCCLQF